MTTETGSRLGDYEILEPIGAGGMGEVFRARDLRLGREVAIKLLPEDLLADSDRRARFEREARMLASLNHPNVATLFGSSSGDGEIPYLAMELVDGPTLADEIARGPIGVERTLQIFLQIAQGLDAAHQSGVVHRDLKPANVKITTDAGGGDHVKILDFGLAKGTIGEASDGPSATESPTLTLAATQRGEILGTAGYMSPEQGRGGDVDKRTDVWAFGCCLFEALSGQRLWRGDSVADTLADVLRSEPDWARLTGVASPQLERLLRRCLEKSAGDRLRDIGDAAHEIREMLESGPGSPTTTQRTDPDTGHSRAGNWKWAAAAALFGVGLGVLAALQVRPAVSEPAAPVRRFTESPAVVRSIHSLALSPDGSLLAVVEPRVEDGIFLRRLDAAGFHTIAGTESGEFPFFSPDGQHLGFFTTSGQDLRTIPVTGGEAVVLAGPLGRNWGGSWGDDGWIVFHSLSAGNGLSRIREVGGVPEVLTTPDPERGERSHRWPQILPGSQGVLFTIWKGSADVSEIALLDRTGGTIRVLTDGTFGRHHEGGYLSFFRDERMVVARFDEAKGEIGTETVRVPGMELGGPWGYRPVAVTPDGLRVHAQRPTSRVDWADRQGNRTPLSLPEAAYRHPVISPDGGHFAISMSQGGGAENIWVFDENGGSPRQLTGIGENDSAVWTLDGESVVFWSERAGDRTPYRQAIDPGAEAIRLVQGPQGRPTDITPDGRWVGTNHINDIFLVALDGSGTVEPLVETPFTEGTAVFSPDGDHFLYFAVEFDQNITYLTSRSGNETKHRIEQGGYATMRWSPDGSEIFVQSTQEPTAIVSRKILADGTVGPPTELFPNPFRPQPSLDWDTDGERFLVIADDKPPTLHYVEGWFSEIDRLLTKD